MRFTIPFAVLSKLLARVDAVQKSSKLSARTLVALSVDGSTLTTNAQGTGYFGDLWVTQTEAVSEAVNGSANLDTSTLRKALKGGAARDSVTVEVVEGTVTISVGEESPLRFKVPAAGLDPDNWPTPAPVLPVRALLESRDLVRGFGTVEHAISVDEGRPNICGACLRVIEGRLVAVGTDGHRLATWACEAAGDDGEIGILPGFVVRAVSTLKDEGNPAEVGASSTHISVRCGTVTYTASRSEYDRYPNYEQVIPFAKPERRTSIERAPFEKLLKRAAGLVNPKSNAVNFTSDGGGTLEVSWIDADGEAFSTSLGFQNPHAHKFSVRFNVAYWLDALDVFTGERVDFEVIDTLSPTRVTADNDRETLLIIMPMR